MPDDELDAMAALVRIFEPMEQDVRQRTWNWAGHKFGMLKGGETTVARQHTGGAGDGDKSFATLAELFDAVNPQSEKEKALAAAYWLQFVEMEEEFPSADVNTRLRDLGHRIKNVTDAIYKLQQEKPARMVQLKKSGSSKQARKTYKVTEAGRRSIEQFIARDRSAAP
jgi:hypothetical protein